jgi:hypothetical protein
MRVNHSVSLFIEFTSKPIAKQEQAEKKKLYHSGHGRDQVMNKYAQRPLSEARIIEQRSNPLNRSVEARYRHYSSLISQQFSRAQ